MTAGGMGPQVTDDRTIAVPYKVLNAELQCPVCMSIVKNACVIMEVRRSGTTIIAPKQHHDPPVARDTPSQALARGLPARVGCVP